MLDSFKLIGFILVVAILSVTVMVAGTIIGIIMSVLVPIICVICLALLVSWACKDYPETTEKH